MNQRLFLGLIGLCLSLTVSQATSWSTENETAKRRILYNSDGTSLFNGNNDAPGSVRTKRSLLRETPVTVEQLLAQVDEVAGMQVDTFLVCPVDYQTVLYRSDLERRSGDGLTDEDLYDAGVSMRNRILALRHFDSLGVDPFALVVKRIRAKGMEPLATIRLQAAHSFMGSAGAARAGESPWWRAHPKYRLQAAGGGEAGSCLNFAFPEVRARKLALILEFVEKYEFDGAEIDFQRFPLYFEPGQEAANIETMNEFMRELRRAFDELGAKRGRRLVLSAKVPETLARCHAIGLDPVTWVNEGLLEFLSLSRFVHQNIYDAADTPHLAFDLASFRRELTRDVPIYGTINVAYSFPTETPGKPAKFYLTPDDYRWEARHLYEQGFDGIEVFNFFDLRVEWDRGDLPVFLFRELGDPKLIGRLRVTPEEMEFQRFHRLPALPQRFQEQREAALP